MTTRDNKGIFSVIHPVLLTTDLMPDEDAAQFVGSHTVDANIRARWQDHINGPRLLDWQLVELWMDGVSLNESNLPSDFPMQQIINGCTTSSRMRKRLEAMGPGEES